MPAARLAHLATGRGRGLDALTTDRGDVGGTGHWSPATGNYRMDLLRRALGAEPHLPTVLGPADSPGRTTTWAAGCALRRQRRCRNGSEAPYRGRGGLLWHVRRRLGRPWHRPRTRAARSPDSATPPGTSCRWRAHSTRPGSWTWPPGCSASTMMDCPAWRCRLPLVPTAWSSRPVWRGSAPDPPDAIRAVHGLRLATSTPAHLSRAAVEGALCGLADGRDALVAQGARVELVLLIDGAPGPSPCASSHRRCSAAPSWCLRRRVTSPTARPGSRRGCSAVARRPPTGGAPGTEAFHADPVTAVHERYAGVRGLVAAWPDAGRQRLPLSPAGAARSSRWRTHASRPPAATAAPADPCAAGYSG